jgi:hypothetical protein
VREYPKFTFKSFIEEGSYLSERQFCLHPQGVLFELSFPKYYYGTNIKTFWNFTCCLCELRELFLSVYPELPSILEWFLKRVDISYSFLCDDIIEVERTINYFEDYQLRGKLPYEFHRNESVMWKRYGDSIKIYNKAQEVRDHFKYHSNLPDPLPPVIRFEHTWRTKYIMDKLKLPSRSKITVGLFLKAMGMSYDFDKHLDILFKDGKKKEYFKDLDTLLLKVQNKDVFGKKYANYLKFINEVVIYGLNWTKNSMKQQTFSYYKNRLLSNGIDIVSLSNFFEKQKQGTIFVNFSRFDKKHIY